MTPEYLYDGECLDAFAANDCTFAKDDLYDVLSTFCDPETYLPGVFGDADLEWEGGNDGA